MRWIWIVSVMLRLIAALVLAFGPATDSSDELSGWDAARFHAIATTPGTPWIDHAVEYPPGTVLIAEALATGDPNDPERVVGTNQRLILGSLLVDLALAYAIRHDGLPWAAVTYLGLGTLMLPMGLLRLDLWAALPAGIAMLALRRGPPERWSPALVGGLAITLGWLIKLFPAVIMIAAAAQRSWRLASVGAATSLLAVGVWVTVGGPEAIGQMLSLRGVDGWHLESVPGSLVALFGNDEPRLESDAFRIGTLSPTVTLVGRLLCLAVFAGLGALAWRANKATPLAFVSANRVALGSTAALVVTAPLLSPQFLLWLSPFAALLVGQASDLRRPEVVMTAAAMALTSATLALFGPPDLDHPLAALLLLGRDGLLVAIVVVSGRGLWRTGSACPAGGDRPPSTIRGTPSPE